MAQRVTYFLLIILSGCFLPAFSQDDGLRRIGNRVQQFGGPMRTGGGGGDSLGHRNFLEDSISISFRYLDSARQYRLDSSMGDFYRRYPVPATWIHLGNTGTAARSLLFAPNFSAGFDPGFHAFDPYLFKVEKARFFSTTRPYSELNYLLGSRVEQVIEILHTQNLKPNWNFNFQYRLINSPGFFKSQKTNHNNYLLSSWFQSMNKRYNNYLAIAGNKMQSGENGGIQDTANFLKDPVYKDRFNIYTKLGGDDPFSSNFFTTKINTGNKYNEFTFLMRQQFDLGRKDSIVTDSTIIPLFYPRLRFEHEFRLDQNKYTFLDYNADSLYYKTYYDTALVSTADTIIVRDFWKLISNDFSIYQFPDANNLQQFIKLGILLQNISGEFNSGKKSFVNTIGHAEYRNRTRNLAWDIEANGKLFFTGLNKGDFQAHISLQRDLGKKIGSLRLGFENTSRTPSFIFDSRSSFYFSKNPVNFKKENNTHLFASYFLPVFRFRITGHYYLMTNYAYIRKYYIPEQESSLFNVLQIAIQKTIKLGKKWNWHAELYFQQTIGDAPVNVPALYSRNRIGYEGNLGFKNLDIAFGTEIKYRSPYKAADYSPILGHFFYQDTIRVRNPLPDIAAYIHFRIRPFKAFFRIENLNTARKPQGEGLSFTNNNLLAPNYALPGLQVRLGVFWSFVN